MVLKIDERYDHAFKNVEDAVKYMVETDYERDVTVYDINTDKAYKKVSEIYKILKEYNKGKPLNEQILPTNPFPFRGIIGCLGVQAYSISLGKYEKNHKLIALFKGWNQSVLDTSNEDADITPSAKAISSLFMVLGM